MQEWRIIQGFPNYEVSNRGRVRNFKNRKHLKALTNQNGTMYVGLYQDRTLLRRSVHILVAKEFLPPPKNHHFNAVLHKNLDMSDNKVENLCWRPRWYAMRYRRFMLNDKKPISNKFIQNETTGEIYSNTYMAALSTGLTQQTIWLCIVNDESSWYSDEFFSIID